MRFIAPPREAVSADVFGQRVFAGLSAYRDLLSERDWPTLAALNDRLMPLRHRITGRDLSFVEQAAVLADAVHYELRIFREAAIATRADNWHDLLNALIWARYPAIKSALNARQSADIERIGSQRRTRAQDALTQFDEAGAMVCVHDPRLLALWDGHDWPGLFLAEAEAWRDGRIEAQVFGHALLEHALAPGMLLTAKCLVWFDPQARLAASGLDACLAERIAGGECLNDPQALRPLPLSGIPGWHGGTQDAGFYRNAACFRPLRPGRRYPPPLNGSDEQAAAACATMPA